MELSSPIQQGYLQYINGEQCRKVFARVVRNKLIIYSDEPTQQRSSSAEFNLNQAYLIEEGDFQRPKSFGLSLPNQGVVEFSCPTNSVKAAWTKAIRQAISTPSSRLMPMVNNLRNLQELYNQNQTNAHTAGRSPGSPHRPLGQVPSQSRSALSIQIPAPAPILPPQTIQPRSEPIKFRQPVRPDPKNRINHVQPAQTGYSNNLRHLQPSPPRQRSLVPAPSFSSSSGARTETFSSNYLQPSKSSPTHISSMNNYHYSSQVDHQQLPWKFAQDNHIMNHSPYGGPYYSPPPTVPTQPLYPSEYADTAPAAYPYPHPYPPSYPPYPHPLPMYGQYPPPPPPSGNGSVLDHMTIGQLREALKSLPSEVLTLLLSPSSPSPSHIQQSKESKINKVVRNAEEDSSDILLKRRSNSYVKESDGDRKDRKVKSKSKSAHSSDSGDGVNSDADRVNESRLDVRQSSVSQIEPIDIGEEEYSELLDRNHSSSVPSDVGNETEPESVFNHDTGKKLDYEYL